MSTEEDIFIVLIDHVSSFSKNFIESNLLI